MHNLNPSLQSSLIASAILNKYENVSTQEIYDIIASCAQTMAHGSEPELLARLTRVASCPDDISNQCVILTLIDKFWSSPPKLQTPLSTLNACLCSPNEATALRVVQYVEDFGGSVATPIDEIRARLDELEHLCANVVKYMVPSAMGDKAFILAYIHGAIIRIHPFVDGNGRTARFFVFYALRCWDMPLFPIPKVRNDPAWERAMTAAVAGDFERLRDQVLQRMIGADSALTPAQ
jgi:Fic/DOC family